MRLYPRHGWIGRYKDSNDTAAARGRACAGGGQFSRGRRKVHLAEEGLEAGVGGGPDLATRPSSTRHKVTNSHRQSERYQRTDKHHDAPRDNPHGSSQSFPGALCATFILVIFGFVR